MKVEIFKHIADTIDNNIGKHRAVHIRLTDGIEHVVCRINADNERFGKCVADSAGECLLWNYTSDKYTEEHVTSLDSITDVWVNVMED